MEEVFTDLRAIMARHAGHLDVMSDEPGNYCVDTFHVMKNGKPLFFGAVKLKKSYVAYHLMPVYVRPALLDGLSEDLRKRMQGKSCFNFRKPDPVLFAQLEDLTARGLADYAENGLLGTAPRA